MFTVLKIEKRANSLKQNAKYSLPRKLKKGRQYSVELLRAVNNRCLTPICITLHYAVEYYFTVPLTNMYALLCAMQQNITLRCLPQICTAIKHFMQWCLSLIYNILHLTVEHYFMVPLTDMQCKTMQQNIISV